MSIIKQLKMRPEFIFTGHKPQDNKRFYFVKNINSETPVGTEIKGIHIKTSSSNRRTRGYFKAAKRALAGKSRLFDLQCANKDKRVANTRANRKKIICNYLQAGYTAKEAKAEIAKLIKIFNGVSYIHMSRKMLSVKMIHRDFFTIPTRPGILFRRPKDNERVFASVEEAENMLSKEIGPVKMEPMWNGNGFAIVPKE